MKNENEYYVEQTAIFKMILIFNHATKLARLDLLNGEKPAYYGGEFNSKILYSADQKKKRDRSMRG